MADKNQAAGATLDMSARGQLKQLDAEYKTESCPHCGQEMPGDMGKEQGGKHTLMGAMTGTNYPGYKLRKGQKISGG